MLQNVHFKLDTNEWNGKLKLALKAHAKSSISHRALSKILEVINSYRSETCGISHTTHAIIYARPL